MCTSQDGHDGEKAIEPFYLEIIWKNLNKCFLGLHTTSPIPELRIRKNMIATLTSA